MERLLTVKETLDIIRVSYPTLLRWRKMGTFPNPVNERGHKLLWTQSSIEQWMSRQTPINTTPVTSATQQRREATNRQRKQAEARARLEKHRIKK